MAALSSGERAFIAASAGNHGLGVACAGRALGLAAYIVAPSSSAEKKREGIRAFGAALSIEGADYDEAEATKSARAREGLAPVSPFDDEAVIAGNGAWLARELLAQRPFVRRVVVPIGGGGLAAGLLASSPYAAVEVSAVQPEGANAMARSLASGAAILVDHVAKITLGSTAASVSAPFSSRASMAYASRSSRRPASCRPSRTRIARSASSSSRRVPP